MGWFVLANPWWKKRVQAKIECPLSFTVLNSQLIFDEFHYQLRNRVEAYIREQAFTDFTNENMCDFFDALGNLGEESLLTALLKGAIPLYKPRKKWWMFW